MPRITVAIDARLLTALDRLIAAGRFPNRSQAISAALGEKLRRLPRQRLARESAKLDRACEQAMADVGLPADVGDWPEY